MSTIYYSKKFLIICIFLLSCFFSLVFLIFFNHVDPPGHKVPGTDYSSCYAPMAENIIQGRNIIVDKEYISKGYIKCAPGYPLFLVPIFFFSQMFSFDKLMIIIFFNIILTALSSVVLFFITKPIFGKNVALIASFLWMSYPFNQWLVKNPNTEVPFIALLLMGLLLYLYFFLKKGKKYYLFLAGAIWGFASLIRPLGILLSLVFIILIFFISQETSFKKKIMLCLLIILGNVAIIMPWELYVLTNTGNIAPLSDAGPEAIRVGFSFGAVPGKEGQQFNTSSDVMDFMKRINASEIANHRSYSEIFMVLKREITRSPMAFIKIIFIKLLRSWYATSEMWFENKILLVQIPYLILSIFGAIVSITSYKDKKIYAILLLSIVGYFWFVTTVTFSIMRYMIPAMGIVLIFSALAINTLILKNVMKNE